MGYLLVLGVVLAICYGINAAMKRTVVNPGRVGLIVIALVLAIDLAVAISVLSKVADRMSSFGQGQFIGGVFGRALIAIVVAGVLDISHRRKSRAAPQVSV
jgi:hypothetical protein